MYARFLRFFWPVGILITATSGNATASDSKGAAPAEPLPAGSMYRHAETSITARELATGRVRKSFARCVYGYRASDIDAYLISPNYEDGWAKLAGARKGKPSSSSSVFTTCLGREAGLGDMTGRMNIPSFRLMMAEEAYLSRFEILPQPPADAVEVLSRVPLTVGSVPEASAVLAAVADCLVYRDLSGADALVRTMLGSSEERAAAVSLAAAVGGCLPKDQTLKLNVTMIRSLAVEGLWARYARTVH
jgi:hypothetical protein